jgi:hypothetical protein
MNEAIASCAVVALVSVEDEDDAAVADDDEDAVDESDPMPSSLSVCATAPIRPPPEPPPGGGPGGGPPGGGPSTPLELLLVLDADWELMVW